MSGSWFTFAAGRKAKWVVFAIWFVGIFVAAGPAELPSRFEDAENNEATSYLPGSAESTAALEATEELQDGDIAPAAIVFRDDNGLTPGDFKIIEETIGRMTSKEFEGVIPDGATAASGGKPDPEARGRRSARRRPSSAPRRPRRSPASPPATNRSSARSAPKTARRRSSAPTSTPKARANGSPTRSSSGATSCPRNRAAACRRRSPAAPASQPTRSKSSKGSTAPCCWPRSASSSSSSSSSTARRSSS